MFNIFKRKKTSKDPFTEALKKQNAELREITEKLMEISDRTENAIYATEEALRKLGYTDEDFERIKHRSRITLEK